MEVILKRVRASFPNWWKPGDPRTGDDGKPVPGKYGNHGLFDVNSEAYKAAMKAFNEVATQKWGANARNVVGALSKDKMCIRKGNQMLDKGGAVRNGYKDKFYIVANNKAKPAIAAHKFYQGKPVIIGEDGMGYVGGKLIEDVGFEIVRPYGGCYVNMKVDIYAMDKPGKGKSINATLLAVQFADHGDPFGAAQGTAEGFGEEDFEPNADFSGGQSDGASSSDDLFGGASDESDDNTDLFGS